MKLFKTLLTFCFIIAILSIPFLRISHTGSMAMTKKQPMPTTASECASYCSTLNHLPNDQIGFLHKIKGLEREPVPLPANYWQFTNSYSLAALYLLLPIVLLRIYYKDPKLILGTRLRF